ncbi:MAG: S8 family serine peptidase, partial [Planctomycetaceae bacterium]
MGRSRKNRRSGRTNRGSVAFAGAERLEERLVLAALVKIPNDTSFGQQWALNSTAYADINAPEAWYLTTGNKDIVVAVLDDGTYTSHPDLQANLWNREWAITKVPAALQAQFKAEYGTFGWDSLEGDGDVTPTAGHGTAVAGTIGAVGNNFNANNGGLGSISGINWNVSIYTARVAPSAGTTPSVADFNDAVQRICDLRNLYHQNVVAVVGSFAGVYTTVDPGFDAGVQQLNAAGILFVAPAGEVDTSSKGIQIDPPWIPPDPNGYFPASGGTTVTNNIVVAASTSTDTLATWSDYGPATVQIAAPGQGVLSLAANNRLGQWSGTSIAAGYVAGTAALAAAEYYKWTRNLPSVNFMRQAVLNGAATVAGLAGKVENNRRLDAYGALHWVDTHLPPQISVGTV